MKELVDKIGAAYALFQNDVLKTVTGNNAAGRRARVYSITLTKLLREFRKVSVEQSKKA